MYEAGRTDKSVLSDRSRTHRVDNLLDGADMLSYTERLFNRRARLS